MLESAEEEARRIIRAIRQNIFSPPQQPPRYSDAFAALCLDGECADRAQVIAHMNAMMSALHETGGEP